MPQVFASQNYLKSKLIILSIFKEMENNYKDEWIDDFHLPKNENDVNEKIEEIIFVGLKTIFKGCKIRKNRFSYSIRLNNHVHQKVDYLLREIYENNERRDFLNQNHKHLVRNMDRIRDFYNSNHGSLVKLKKINDLHFAYVPFRLHRIHYNDHNSFSHLFHVLIDFRKKCEELAQEFEQIVGIIKEEEERVEKERALFIEKRKNEHVQKLRENLLAPVIEKELSSDPREKLYYKIYIEKTKEGIAYPYYPKEQTIERMVPVGTTVKVMAQKDKEEEGWMCFPIFHEPDVPENYEIKDGWGEVTSIDFEHERSRKGLAPIVMQNYIFTEYNPEFWLPYLPEDFEEISKQHEQILKEVDEKIDEYMTSLEQQAHHAEQLSFDFADTSAEEAVVNPANELHFNPEDLDAIRHEDDEDHDDDDEEIYGEEYEEESQGVSWLEDEIRQTVQRNERASEVASQTSQEELSQMLRAQIEEQNQRRDYSLPAGIYYDHLNDRFHGYSQEGEHFSAESFPEVADWYGIPEGESYVVKSYYNPTIPYNQFTNET